MKKSVQISIFILFFSAATQLVYLPTPVQAGWALEYGIPSIDKLRAIRGYSPESVFAMGDYGTMLFYNGIGWSALETVTDKTIYGIGFYCPCEIFASADKGRVLHFSGTAWTHEVLSDNRLRAIWAASGKDVFAAGEHGTMLHFDGISWKEMSVPTDKTLQAVWGFHGGDVYAAGGPSGTGGVGTGVMIHYDSTSWSIITDGAYPRFKAVWGSPSEKLYVVGDGGIILLYNPKDDSFSEFYSNNAEGLRDIWGTSDSNIFAVGDYGTILRYDGSQWSTMNAGTSENLFGVWVYSEDLAFAAGDSGTIVRYDSASPGDDNGTEICPFVLALNNRDDLRLLRRLRDQRLVTVKGLDIVKLFYEHAAEIAHIVQRHPDIRRALAACVLNNRQLIQDLLDDGRAGITQQKADEIVMLLERLQQEGSTQLQSALTFALNGIQTGRLLEQTGVFIK